MMKRPSRLMAYGARGAHFNSALCAFRFASSRGPPLSLLSWSLDASCHSHHRCRRRLSFEERLGSIVQTIRLCGTDVVAVQDSSEELASAFLDMPPKPHPTLTVHEIDMVRRYKGNAVAKVTAGKDESQTEESPKVEEEEELPNYILIGSAKNGKCGYCHTFLRQDSVWKARLLPHDTGVTVELSASEGQGEPIRCILSNVDLSYRGKSLGKGGQLLSSVEVSQQGSPFSLSTGDTNKANTTVKGMMDPHRSVALDYLSRVTRADVILGNFLLPRNDGLEGYEDAFKLCGSPPQHERTINTFRRHAFDKLTNYYYFVPSPGLKKHRKNGKSGNGEQKETVTLADTKDVNSVGTPLPLSATRTAEGVWVDTKEEATILSPEAPAGGNAATSLERSEKWIYDHLADLSNQYNRDLAVPQVAGRFQRCYFRNNFKSSRTHSNQYSPFLLRYNKRCRTVVPKPFVQVELGENEARWQASNDAKGTNDGEAEESVSLERVSCSLSDQYPVFVQLL